MDREQTTDVNKPEGETGSSTSNDNQTTEGSTETTSQPVEGTEGKSDETTEPKTVPYERFKEVNEGYRETKESVAQLKSEIKALQDRQNATPNSPQNPELEAKKNAAKDTLKQLLGEMGYVSKDELRQREDDRALDTEMKDCEREYNGKDGRPKFDRKQVVEYALKHNVGDPRAAYQLLNQPALINWHVQQAIKKSKGIQTEGSNGSGSQNVGTSDDDLKAAIAKGDQRARQTYLKRISSRVLGNSTRKS